MHTYITCMHCCLNAPESCEIVKFNVKNLLFVSAWNKTLTLLVCFEFPQTFCLFSRSWLTHRNRKKKKMMTRVSWGFACRRYRLTNRLLKSYTIIFLLFSFVLFFFLRGLEVLDEGDEVDEHQPFPSLSQVNSARTLSDLLLSVPVLSVTG